MHDPADLVRVLLAHDGERVGGGRARMDHERLARLARGADVRRKRSRCHSRSPSSGSSRARFADGDDLRRAAFATRSSTLGSGCPGSRDARQTVAYRLSCACAIATTAGHAGESTLMHTRASRRCRASPTSSAEARPRARENRGDSANRRTRVGLLRTGGETALDAPSASSRRVTERCVSEPGVRRFRALDTTSCASAASTRASRPGSSRWWREPRRRSRPG